MNILMVTDFFFPDVMGGSGRVVYEMGRELVQRGNSVWVLTRNQNGKLPPEDDIEGMQVFRFPFILEPSIWNTLTSVRQMREGAEFILQEFPIDLVHFHHDLSAWAVLRSKKIRGIPKFFTFHSPWAEEYKISFQERTSFGNISLRQALSFPLNRTLRAWVELSVLKSMDRIHVLSQFMQERLLAHCPISPERIQIIPGGVDVERFHPPEDRSPVRKELGFPPDQTVLFTVRNLRKRMGLESLIRAMKRIKARLPRVYLIIGGSGPLRQALEELARENDVEDLIRFEGYIPDEKLPSYYQAADLFVLPTLKLEGFGLVTLEALACGTPVFGTNVGGTREILGKFEKGFLMGKADPDGIFEGVVRIVESRKLTENLRRRCRDFAYKNYRWKTIVDEIERAYCFVLN